MRKPILSLLLVVLTAIVTGCAPAPAPVAPAKRDATKEEWYGRTVEQLSAANREAEGLFRGGKPDQAAEAVMKGQALANRLLAVPRPTLQAMEAASDLDDLYARMLLSNRHYGWARLTFQKNLARWKNWEPKTPETARRMRLAASGIAECDRRLTESHP